jgi:hypothetical protein
LRDTSLDLAVALATTKTLGEANGNGFLSSVFGGLAVIAAIAAKQFELLRRPRSGHVLELAHRLGILREPDRWAEPEISDTTFLTITDGRLISALGTFGAYLAMVAIAFALRAEYREEDSLYLGVGFLCGGLTLFLLHQTVGSVAMAIGVVAIIAMRRQNRPVKATRLKSQHD